MFLNYHLSTTCFRYDMYKRRPNLALIVRPEMLPTVTLVTIGKVRWPSATNGNLYVSNVDQKLLNVGGLVN